MIIIETGEDGKSTIRIESDPPSNYHCREWEAYDQACNRAQEQGEQWTQEQDETYRNYHDARVNNSFTPTIGGRVRSFLGLPLDE